MSLDTQTIHAAADRIADSGEKPTLARVRRELGGGSFTTISEAMQSWRERQTEEHALAEIQVPGIVDERIEQLKAATWQAAIGEAERRLSAEREALHEAQEQAAAQVKEAAEAVETLETEALVRDEQIAGIGRQLKDAVAAVTAEKNQAHELAQSHAAETAQHKEKISGLESRLDDAVEARKAAEKRETTIQKEVDTLNSKVSHLVDKNLDLEKALATSQAQASERESTITILRSELSTLKKEYKEEISLLKKAHDKNLVEQKESYETRLKDKDRAIAKLETKVDDAEKMLFEEIDKAQRSNSGRAGDRTNEEQPDFFSDGDNKITK
ncbi:DNA-binding protein [Vreelandella rituensis]|uniref:KfrA N-terminal DNA-binding domain-containing protein n=1 Tax=Vreelandella rituensis TaxID=2282306 RepID=A0A368TP09_9GAMM|nr:DNA-binding protein [Halomonas rituensis]RCV86036.1 hypothetical protein DU506_19300 [Halomonas rituensis]